MKITIAIASAEAALVLAWIGSFFRVGVAGSYHEHWYVELPVTFLAIPILTSGVAFNIRNSTGEWRISVHFLLVMLLVANLIGFFVYALMSGGGV
jgi:thiosulfate reductase cytochrome b subunit